MEGIFDDKDKNLFPIGGFMPINIPAVFRGVGKKLRDRMYRTIRPEEYSLEQVENFVKGTPRQYYRNPNAEALLGKYTGQDSIIADYTQAPDYLTGGRYLTEEEKARLGVSSESTLKKYAVDDIIIPSKSKEGAFEFAYPNRLGSVPHLPANANRVPNDSWPHSHELGTFHQVKINNGNGSSVTYKDTYDINPFRGKSSEDDSTWRDVIRIGKKVSLDKIGDIVPWGKPFEMHGQQSYDKDGYPKKAEGGFLQPRDTWDALSMKEKAEMIGVAVKNGITNLNDIRDKYNEFAEGGNTDDDLVDWIIREEGFIGSPQDIGDGKMTIGSGLTAQKWHDQYKRNGNRWTIDDNRRAVKEEVASRRRWAEKNIPNWDSLPSSSQKALLSYKYNYDFNRANSPKLFKALADSNLQEAARQMDATSSNAVFRKGLQERRQREQEWFLRDVASPQVPNTFYQPAVSTQVYNPYTQQVEATKMLSVNEPDPNSYIRTREASPQEQRRRKFQENVEAYRRFNALMDMIDIKKNQAPSYVPNHPLFELVNGFAEGGSKAEEEEVNTVVPFTQRREVIITPDSEYNQYLNTLPDNQRFTPNDKYDSYFYWKLNGRPKNFDEAYSKGMFHYDNSDKSYHANSIAFGKDGIGYFMKPKTHDTVGYELDWFNKGLITEEGGHQRHMTPEEKKEWLEFRKDYILMSDPNRPNYYKYQPKKKAEGGSIHIKPENRGKFTALKERTGHSATWFKEHGTPAQKKMATFALNSKKWHKHSLGGYLEGQVYDVPESEVMNLINAGYEIEYI